MSGQRGGRGGSTFESGNNAFAIAQPDHPDIIATPNVSASSNGLRGRRGRGVARPVDGPPRTQSPAPVTSISGSIRGSNRGQHRATSAPGIRGSTRASQASTLIREDPDRAASSEDVQASFRDGSLIIPVPAQFQFRPQTERASFRFSTPGWSGTVWSTPSRIPLTSRQASLRTLPNTSQAALYDPALPSELPLPTLPQRRGGGFTASARGAPNSGPTRSTAPQLDNATALAACWTAPGQNAGASALSGSQLATTASSQHEDPSEQTKVPRVPQSSNENARSAIPAIDSPIDLEKAAVGDKRRRSEEAEPGQSKRARHGDEDDPLRNSPDGKEEVIERPMAAENPAPSTESDRSTAACACKWSS